MVAIRSAMPDPSSRPRLHLIEGGRSSKALAATYRRRRLAALAVGVFAVVAVVVLGLAGLRAAAAALAPTSQAGPPAGAGAVGEHAYLVQPGDTLWSIAGSLDPEGDRRATVDRLVAAAGGPELQPGDRIDLGAAMGLSEQRRAPR